MLEKFFYLAIRSIVLRSGKKIAGINDLLITK